MILEVDNMPLNPTYFVKTGKTFRIIYIGTILYGQATKKNSRLKRLFFYRCLRRLYDWSIKRSIIEFKSLRMQQALPTARLLIKWLDSTKYDTTSQMRHHPFSCFKLDTNGCDGFSSKIGLESIKS